MIAEDTYIVGSAMHKIGHFAILAHLKVRYRANPRLGACEKLRLLRCGRDFSVSSSLCYKLQCHMASEKARSERAILTVASLLAV
eukprot:4578193-Amphidinium_carterae.1